MVSCEPKRNPNVPHRSKPRAMSDPAVQESAAKPLLERMVVNRQLSAIDAEVLAGQQRSSTTAPVQTEEDVLRWLAREYGLAYTNLDDIEPDRQLLSLFPARILLKEELLP